MAGRNASGNASAQNATVQPTTPEWLKQLQDDTSAKPFSEILPTVQADVEAEYPDFGAQIPDGNYFTTLYGSEHLWKSRRGTTSKIRTMWIRRESDNKLFEVALASFVNREEAFIPMEGQPMPSFLLDFDASQATTARRNLRVMQLADATPIKIGHTRGHWSNPLATRINNFNLTFVVGR